LGTNKTPYFAKRPYWKNPYTEIKEEKASLISTNPFCNAGGCVYWWKWNPFCNIKDAMYWWNFKPFCNIFCLRYCIYSIYIMLQVSNGR
jgi:hypothetical protein